MDTRIALRYTGPAVDSGQMDVYAASANMIAFSEFAVLAAKSAFGANVTAKANVAGFSRGSFVTDLAITVIGPSATIFTVMSPEMLWDLVKEAIGIWKHLQGAPPQKIEHINDGNLVNVENNNGQVIQVHTTSLSVVLSDKGSETVAQFVKKALETDGMEALELKADDRPVERIDQKEARYFVPVIPEKVITDTVVKMGLVLESPVFKDNLKWRFYDGQQSFHADIEDREFIERVNSGTELFGKGDVLYAEVRISQRQSGMKLVAERTVVKVLEHKRAAQQLSLK